MNLGRKLFNCHACGARGSILDFVAQIEKVSIPEAARIIGNTCGIPMNEGKAPRTGDPTACQAHSGKEGTTAPSGRASAAREASGAPEQMSTSPRFALTLDPKHPYLKERGLTPGVIEEFGIGYSLSRVFMSGRVCIPIHSPDGELVAYAGRWASHDVPPGVPKYLLPRGFKKSEVLFNLHRVASADHVTLVEGYWSVFRLHALGIPAVALMGRTLSTAQEELLACSGARFLTLLLDGDEPGRTAAQALLPRVARNWFVYHAELPDGQQPDTVDEQELRRMLWAL